MCAFQFDGMVEMTQRTFFTLILTQAQQCTPPSSMEIRVTHSDIYDMENCLFQSVGDFIRIICR